MNENDEKLKLIKQIAAMDNRLNDVTKSMIKKAEEFEGYTNGEKRNMIESTMKLVGKMIEMSIFWNSR